MNQIKHKRQERDQLTTFTSTDKELNLGLQRKKVSYPSEKGFRTSTLQISKPAPKTLSHVVSLGRKCGHSNENYHGVPSCASMDLYHRNLKFGCTCRPGNGKLVKI